MATAYSKPDTGEATPVNSRTAQWLGGLSCLLGLVVVAGWYAGNLAIIQLRSDLTPMSFNSALMFVVCGAALITVARRKLLWVRLLAGIGLLLSALTMSQYFTDIDLGIDQLMLTPHIEQLAGYDGRMSLTGAFCFLLLNTGFLIFTLDRSSRLTRAVTTVCASIVIACVIATVIGFKTDIQPLFGWKASAFMALHTAFGIFMLSTGLLVCSLGLSRRRNEHNHLSSAAAGFIVVATATLLLWSGLSRQQDDQMQSSMADDLHWLDSSILSLYREHVNAVERMGMRWEVARGTAQNLWMQDAGSYLNTLGGLRSLSWVDAVGIVQWQQSKAESRLPPGTNLGSSSDTTTAFTLARDKHKTAFTKPTRATGEARFLMLRPLFVDNTFAGMLVAEFQISALFDTFQQLGSTIPFQVKFGPTPVYTSSLFVRLGDEVVLSASTPLAIADGGWSLQIKDDSSMRSDLRSYLPLIVLTTGTAMAAFFSALLGLAGLTRQNLQETRHANAALEDSKHQLNQFRTTLDRTLDCVFMIDALTLTYFYGNAGALRLAGCSAGQLHGKTPWEVNPALTEASFRQRVMPLLNQEMDSLTFESIFQNADGSVTPLDCFMQYIAVADEPPRFVAIVRDITQRKRVEQMKSEFVSTVSHELRTPLTSITGALGLVRGGALGEVSSTVQDMVDIAYKNSRRLTHLINDLLDIEKIAAGKVNFDMQVQMLMPLVEQAVEGTRTYGTEHNVELEIVQAAEGVEVRIDNQRLLQILSNLLSNAIKFSPEGSKVKISVVTQGAKVRISVRDQGRGIPTEFHGRIFQKFAQADASDSRRQSGTGLGLAISRELAERMGGFLSYDSVFGQGACFYLELPVSNTKAVSGTPGKNNGLKLLVVEDEPDASLLMQQMLGSAGFQAEIATTGARALAAIKQNTYAGIVLDLHLPDMSGIDIIRQLKSDTATAELPIIVVSAYIEDGKLMINGDFSDIVWLPKPVEKSRLQQQLELLSAAQQQDSCLVLHVEDDTDLHEVIRTMAGGSCAFTQASTLTAARQLLQQSKFTVVILDLELPDGSGWDLLPQIHEHQPAARIIILTGQEKTSVELGKVDSVLLKSKVTPEQLLAAIQAKLHSS